MRFGSLPGHLRVLSQPALRLWPRPLPFPANPHCRKCSDFRFPVFCLFLTTKSCDFLFPNHFLFLSLLFPVPPCQHPVIQSRPQQFATSRLQPEVPITASGGHFPVSVLSLTSSPGPAPSPWPQFWVFWRNFPTGSDGSQPHGGAVPAGVTREHGDVIGRVRAEPAQRQGETGSDESGGWGRGVRPVCAVGEGRKVRKGRGRKLKRLRVGKTP